jgi:DNA helicase HerA-like ATPase
MIPKIVLGLGTGYTGKSFLSGWIAAHICRPFVVIVNIRKDPSYLSHIDPSRTRFIKVLTSRYTVTADLLKKTRARSRYLYFSIYDLSPDETKEFFDSLIDAVREVGDLALFIDEAHLFCSRFQASKKLIGFIRGARHYGVDVVLVSQRLKDIDVGIRCVLTHLVLFRTTESSDLEVLSNELGLGQAAAETIRTLPDRQHVFCNRRTGYISPPNTL